MVGEPDAGNPHVRFDEGMQETCFGNAPVFYSTVLVNCMLSGNSASEGGGASGANLTN